MKYYRIPCIYDAFQFQIDKEPEWANGLYYDKDIKAIYLLSHPKYFNKPMYAKKGDFVIKDDEGKIYTCRKEIFFKCYEPVEKEISYEHGLVNEEWPHCEVKIEEIQTED